MLVRAVLRRGLGSARRSPAHRHRPRLAGQRQQPPSRRAPPRRARPSTCTSHSNCTGAAEARARPARSPPRACWRALPPTRSPPSPPPPPTRQATPRPARAPSTIRRTRRPRHPDRLRSQRSHLRRHAKLHLLSQRARLQLPMPLRLRPVRGLLGPRATATPPASALSDGAHTFEVRATDQAQNTDQTPASAAFTVDTQAPAAPTITDTDPDSPANDNDPLVKGSAEGGLDRDPVPVRRLHRGVEAQGSAAGFRRRRAGGERRRRRDRHLHRHRHRRGWQHVVLLELLQLPRRTRPPPDTQIDSGSHRGHGRRHPDLRLLGQRARLDLPVPLRLGPLRACSGPGDSHTPSTPLASGAHTFEVQATDQAQNTDQTPALSAFVVL